MKFYSFIIVFFWHFVFAPKICWHPGKNFGQNWHFWSGGGVDWCWLLVLVGLWLLVAQIGGCSATRSGAYVLFNSTRFNISLGALPLRRRLFGILVRISAKTDWHFCLEGGVD